MILPGLICKVVYLKNWKTAHLDVARHLKRIGVKTCCIDGMYKTKMVLGRKLQCLL